MPHELDIFGPDDDILEHPFVKHITLKNPSAPDEIAKYAYMAEGMSLKATKDPLTLSKLEYGEKLQRPYIKNDTGFDYPKAPNGTKPLMDKIEINQNVFLEIKHKNSDITILPI